MLLLRQHDAAAQRDLLVEAHVAGALLPQADPLLSRGVPIRGVLEYSKSINGSNMHMNGSNHTTPE
jgi:hypothetical protein